MNAIELRKVSLRAPTPQGHAGAPRRQWILRDVSLNIPSRKVLTILGPSGSGKTSLLRLMNRLTEPSEGEILFDGKPLRSFEPTRLRRKIGYVFQIPTMLPGTVMDNLIYPVSLDRSAGRTRPGRAELVERLHQVALDPGYLDRAADRLSVGEQQRVCIARSLMTSPEVLLMDEPTSALDPSATSRLLDLIGDLHERHGLTIVFVTHQLEQARAVGDTTAVLINGQIVEVGPTGEIFASPRSPATRRFLDGNLDQEAAVEISGRNQ